MKTLKRDKRFIEVTEKGGSIVLTIQPFEYDGGNPRLPRKRSDGYDLKGDTQRCFADALKHLNVDTSQRYTVEIHVHQGSDGLGGADLDNYSKAILDGVTSTKRIWADDKQVDELHVKRLNSQENKSKMVVTISPLS